MIFDSKKDKDVIASDGDIVYLCDYIPRKSNRDFFDLRSEELVIAFKDKSKPLHSSAVQIVADHLESVLARDCALVAIPSSKESGNFNSSSHELIHKIVDHIGKERNIINASDCLYRVYDIPSQHSTGKRRDINLLRESTGIQNIEKIKDKDVLMIDDVTSTGNSFIAAREILKSHGALNVIGFAVGKTIGAENFRLGFILDLDGTLFPSDTERMLELRKNRSWILAKTIARTLKPYKGAVDLLNTIRQIDADYRIVTSSPGKYASVLTSKLDIPDDHLIAYHDTKKHKPDIEPYMKAKQQMQIYEPFIVAIGNDPRDIEPSIKLGMTSVLISKTAKPSEFPEAFVYQSIEECFENFWKLTKKSYETWDRIASDYARTHKTKSMDAVVQFNESLKGIEF